MRLFWNIFPAYLLITVAGLLAVTWFATHAFRDFQLEQTRERLKTQGNLIAERITSDTLQPWPSSAQGCCGAFSKLSSSRITIISPDGKVLGDSEEDPAIMDDHGDRPEIMEALAGRTGSSIRYSHTLKKDMMYVAVPLNKNGAVTLVVRTSVPITSIGKTLKNIKAKFMLGALGIAVFLAAVSLVFSRRISRPLEQIRSGAEAISRGDFDIRLPAGGSSETRELAKTMNAMAGQLKLKLQTIQEQQSELDAVFSSMKEGVIAVDRENKIFTFNPSAANLLNMRREDATGKNILEVARNTQLNDFLSRILSGSGTLEENFTFNTGSGERFIQVRGSGLRDEKNRSSGALIVMNDITKLKRLENLRKDFVANVSHELKTPITSIKGAVETLQLGSVENPEDAGRFLEMIRKNSDRLHRIIEDLLSLSRIEQDAEKRSIALEEHPVKNVLEDAVRACELKASGKRIAIRLQLERNFSFPMNPPLLEEAVLNLLDNAVKYSEEAGQVMLRAGKNEKEITISVEDQGPGIPSEHFPRLFERFYRVDKARSRKMGGTGLGLAIVKHIAQIHGGHVTVQSEVGKGSAFTLHFPVQSEPA